MMKNYLKLTTKFSAGFLMIHVLVWAGVGIIIIGGLTNWLALNLRASRDWAINERAFQIAEAGIEYYRWHLAHAPTDFQDGTGQPGPYVHQYYDKNGDAVGQFTLTITPPPLGSTKVVIVSQGQVHYSSTTPRTIEAILAIPSLAKYAFAANAVMRFGEGTEVYGPIHSNDGIQFDGLAHNLISSAKDKYDDPDHIGNQEFAVHTHVLPPPPAGLISDSFRASEAPPNSVPIRSDVFLAGRQFPVPALDFSGLISDLGRLKDLARTTDGLYLPASGAYGYNLILRSDDKVEVRKVLSLVSPNFLCRLFSDQVDDWGSWSIQQSASVATYDLPNNGIIFAEDNLWVEGELSTARLTIVAGRLPESSSNQASITINKNISYAGYDGQESLGLIAQGQINVGLVSADNLHIDGALVAKNGRVGRFHYGSFCSPYHQRQTINLFGMIASNQRYGFAYTDGTGYQDRVIRYDGSFLYGPPPSFPLTTDQYSVISWREI